MHFMLKSKVTSVLRSSRIMYTRTNIKIILHKFSPYLFNIFQSYYSSDVSKNTIRKIHGDWYESSSLSWPRINRRFIVDLNPPVLTVSIERVDWFSIYSPSVRLQATGLSTRLRIGRTPRYERIYFT